MNSKKLFTILFSLLFTLGLSATKQSLASEESFYQQSDTEKYSPLDKEGAADEDFIFDDELDDDEDELDDDEFGNKGDEEDTEQEEYEEGEVL